ncbi:MAG: hypothetical protein M1812_008252 [Candelaria pacifica]|nr:MAG: hypothetical protein M1812_008252 [Candelaria pacifica]
MSQSSKPNILIVLTSTAKIPNSDKPIGWYLPELAHPYKVLAPHCNVTVASPAGGEAPLDPNSVEMFKEDKVSTEFLDNSESVWKNTEKLSNFVGRAKEFDAVFYVGGHGPMFDLATDPTSQTIIREIYESSRIVSAVCHGPAALVNVKLSDNTYLIADQAVTGFSNAEEDVAGGTAAMPFLLEDELNKNSNGKFEKAKENFGECVVEGRDGRLITGQNPASAEPLAQILLRKIQALRAERKV